MTKKIKKLEKETAMYRSRWESSNKALLEMAEEVKQILVLIVDCPFTHMAEVQSKKYQKTFFLYNVTHFVCFVSRNLCVTVTLRHFRVKSSGSRSCGGRSKSNVTSSTRRFRTSVIPTVAPQEPPPLTQGLTPPLHHLQTLCWSPAATLSQTPPPAPSPATVTLNWKQMPY